MASADSKTIPLYPIFTKTKRRRESFDDDLCKPILTKKKIQKRDKRPKKLEQLHLDLGQRDFGHTVCSFCGMVYARGKEEDMREHNKYHANVVNKFKYPVWKNERVVSEFEEGKIVKVIPDDGKKFWNKVCAIFEVISSQLGSATVPNTKDTQVFLYIKNKTVIGFLASKPLEEAHRIFFTGSTSSSIQCRSSIIRKSPQNFINLLSKETFPAQVGVTHIWVAEKHRKKRVATQMLDSLRTHFHPRSIIEKKKIAFSCPTPDGQQLLINYTGSTDFLVY
ncbi:N-acetyltransferase ESCO2-like isoform X2 [Oscarella lobularis]|uniref:N-acetyltransferase ESCO2-like isoform X2 n=1 Tax=Oscarella lobularis TaxID=121494 RepID=UPI003313BC91